MALNVLVVDDSAVMRSMVKKTLDMSGVPAARYLEAANGRDGLDLIDREWIDLVVTDINMPVMGGLEMIAELRRIPMFAELPVIVVSTEPSRARIDAARRMGARFIHKPFTPEEVKETVESLLGDLKDARE